MAKIWSFRFGHSPGTRVVDSLSWRWFVEPASVLGGWLAWIVISVVAATAAFIRHGSHSVTTNYMSAAESWLHGQPMYAPGKDGFLYLPHFGILYVPFWLLPTGIGEALFRLCSLALLASGCWNISRIVSRREWNAPFFAVSLITIGVGAGAVLDGQANVALSGVLMLAAAALANRRWWCATCWFALCIVVKPIGIVPLMIATAIYPALWWRMPIALAVVAGIPFALSGGDAAYVVSQYLAGFAKIMEAGGAMDRPFAELGSVLRFFGLSPSYGAMTEIRIVAAEVVLALAIVARFSRDARWNAILIWALGCAYLMVFNPRTEGVSYVIVAPAFAAIAIRELEYRPLAALRLALAACGIAGGILMMFVHELRLPLVPGIHGATDVVVRPALSMLFMLYAAGLLVLESTDPSDLARSQPAISDAPVR